VLKTIWTTDPVEFDGEYHTIPRSWIGPKPIQKPHPPIYLGAFSPKAVARVARLAQGWIVVAYPLPAMAEMFAAIKAMASEVGRDPDALELLVRANVELFDQPLGDDRMIFTGTLDQVSADVAAAREIGTTELMFDVTFDPGVESVEDILRLMEDLYGLGKGVPAIAPTSGG
jgi:alkanesulfonate monooxygenase SsuD/methylene tetrahydromethanopterin reductase-like flavin-dependent oxidoreductase (luciferase family)